MDSYHMLTNIITQEIAAVLQQVQESEVNHFLEAVEKSNKLFIFAIGRVFLSLQCLGKRLGHLGLDCQVVGSITEKPMRAEDMLIIASGSGESRLPVAVTRIAKEHGGRLALITSATSSTLQSMADVVVHLPCPTKTNLHHGVNSIQSMTSLFDQSLHVFGDILVMLLQQRRGLCAADLLKFHANLE